MHVAGWKETGKNMKDQECSRIKQAIAEAEFVLVGIGAEFREAETGGPDGTAGEERARLREAYDCLERLLKGKPYFVVTENADDVIFTSKLLDFFTAYIILPFGAFNLNIASPLFVE